MTWAGLALLGVGLGVQLAGVVWCWVLARRLEQARRAIEQDGRRAPAGPRLVKDHK